MGKDVAKLEHLLTKLGFESVPGTVYLGDEGPDALWTIVDRHPDPSARYNYGRFATMLTMRSGNMWVREDEIDLSKYEAEFNIRHEE